MTKDELFQTGDQVAEGKQAENELRNYRQHLEELVKERTEEFQNAQKEVEQVFNLSVDIIAVADLKTGFFTQVNPAFSRIIGYTSEEILSRPFMDFVHPDDIDKTADIVEDELISDDLIPHFENRYICKDGSIKWIAWTSQPLPEAGITFVTGRDITVLKKIEMELESHRQHLESLLDERTTELKRTNEKMAVETTTRERAEGKLRESEEQFRTSVENMLDCFGIYSAIRDQSGRIVDFRVEYVNEAACVNNLMSREEQIGQRMCELLPAHRETGLFAEYCQVVETGTLLTKESLLYEDVYGGQRLIRAFDIRVVKLGDGFTAAWRDITERKRAEEALRETQDYLLKAQGIAKIGNWSWERVGDTGFWSEEIYHMLGYTLGEIQPNFEWLLRITHPDDREQVVKDIEESMGTGKSYRGMYRLTGKDGKEITVDSRAEAVLNQAGEATGMTGVIQDITERKQAEGALWESEERYRALVDLGGEIGEAIIMMQDTEQGEGIQTFVSDEWLRISGYSREELLGESFFDLVCPKDRQVSLERHRRKMQGKVIPGLFEMTIIKKDGTEVPIELTSAYTTYQGERANVAYIRDISERKQTEEELKRSEEFLKTVFNSANDAVSIIDVHDFTIIGANDAFLQRLGFKKEKEVIGKTCYEIIYHRSKPCGPADGICPLVEALKTGCHSSAEHMYYDKHGREIYVEVSASPLKDENGSIIQVIHVARDITERRRAEAREQQMQQELNLAGRLASIGELAAGVAHEINNPLTGIIGFSQILLRRSTDQKTSRDLERIHNEARRAARVVQNLLTFARRRQSMKEYADINEVLTRTLELRIYELKTGNIEVVTTLASGLPEAMVDFQQIQQVFLNIILNAEQAMTGANQGGKLTIRTREMKDCIQISFTNNGPGIQAEHLGKLFDPFFTTKGDEGGTGLGLSVCHGIILEHGGRIYAQSEPGKRTTFFVELPLSNDETDKN